MVVLLVILAALSYLGFIWLQRLSDEPAVVRSSPATTPAVAEIPPEPPPASTTEPVTVPIPGGRITLPSTPKPDPEMFADTPAAIPPPPPVQEIPTTIPESITAPAQQSSPTPSGTAQADPGVVQFLTQLQILGARGTGADSRILIGPPPGTSVNAGGTVNADRGIVFLGISAEGNELVFTDATGAVYRRRF